MGSRCGGGGGVWVCVHMCVCIGFRKIYALWVLEYNQGWQEILYLQQLSDYSGLKSLSWRRKNQYRYDKLE